MRAAELHANADRAEGDAGKIGEQARQALRDHYDNWFKPETSREVLLEQAKTNHAT